MLVFGKFYETDELLNRLSPVSSIKNCDNFISLKLSLHLEGNKSTKSIAFLAFKILWNLNSKLTQLPLVG